MAAGSSPPPHLLLVLIILVLQWPEGAVTFQAVTVPNLFATATMRSLHLYLLSNSNFELFRDVHVPEDHRNSVNSILSVCESEHIGAPEKKYEVQQKTDIELLKFSLAFVKSWLSSIQTLSALISSSNQIPTESLFSYEKLRDLQEGFEVILQELGDPSPQELELPVQSYDNFEIDYENEASVMKNYLLMYCLKKDMLRVYTYTKFMKCRYSGQADCS